MATVGASGSEQRSGGEDRASTSTASLGLNVSWAPDLWGRLGDAARAQGAGVQASQADLAGARLSAQGSLAQAYFTLRELDAEAALLQDMTRERLLTMAEKARSCAKPDATARVADVCAGLAR